LNIRRDGDVACLDRTEVACTHDLHDVVGNLSGAPMGPIFGYSRRHVEDTEPTRVATEGEPQGDLLKLIVALFLDPNNATEGVWVWDFKGALGAKDHQVRVRIRLDIKTHRERTDRATLKI
jgi:hypothetical protein